jgi:chromosomal replication initiator protein
VTEHQFETWFRAVVPTGCTDDVFELTVPNTFSREWIAKKYSDLITTEVASQRDGRRPTLRLLVRSAPPHDADPTIGSAVATAAAPVASVRRPGESNGAARRENVQARTGDLPLRPVGAPPAGGWLDPRHVFETFVTGPGNRLAFAAAQSIVESGSSPYNPLFLHSEVGLGKTHLAQAIAAAWLLTHPDMKVAYAPCEQFTNGFIAAVDGGDLEAFRRRYRDVSLLIVDDFHFLSGKNRTQEEFFHTMTHVMQRRGQVVLTAEALPAKIEKLSPRLMSRVAGGMVCEIESPGFAVRLDIARQKADALGFQLTDPVASFIAEQVRLNVRELEGAVTRVVGRAHLLGSEIDMALARDALRDVTSARRRRVTMDHIVQAVTRRYDVRLMDLQGRRRTRAVAQPRQICMYLARRLTSHSLGEIGGLFGGRDHSTVLYGVERITTMAERDPAMREQLEQLAAEARTEASL